MKPAERNPTLRLGTLLEAVGTTRTTFHIVHCYHSRPSAQIESSLDVALLIQGASLDGGVVDGNAGCICES